MQTAKNNGIMKDEIAEIITQLAFYVGWPNAWSAFNVAKKVWSLPFIGCTIPAQPLTIK